MIVISLIFRELSLQINGVPKQRFIKKITANSSNEPLNEWVRAGRIGNTFDFVDVQNAEVSCPLMVGEQRIMVRAEVLWGTHSRDSAIEHSTQGYTVYITGMYAKANDAPVGSALGVRRVN
jgi:hypothetical protein